MSKTYPVLSKEERQMAAFSAKAITSALEKKADSPTDLSIDAQGLPSLQLKLPKQALQVLQEVLSLISEGKPFSLLPSDVELSTQEAADLLQISRPHLIKLLEDGAMPFKKVGTHRRISLSATIAYQQHQKELQSEALDALAEQAQKLNFGY